MSSKVRPSHCPYCGTKLPRVSDPYCPECRRDVDDYDIEEQRREADGELGSEGASRTAITILVVSAVVVIKLLTMLMGG